MSNVRQALLWGVIGSVGILGIPTASGLAAAAELSVDARFLYETTDGIYVDVGTAEGLRKGDTGVLMHSGKPVARIEVGDVASGSAFIRIVADKDPVFPRPGTSVALELDVEEGRDVAPQVVESPPTIKDWTEDEGKPFVPLLTNPKNMSDDVLTTSKNVFHGRLDFEQLYQVTEEEDQDYSRSRVGSSGSLDRIGGTPWSLDWSANLIYRDGEGYEGVRDYRDPATEIYEASFYRRYRDKSFFRIGRFIPRELSSVGYLDGLQAEKVLGEKLRMGVMLGFKPDRKDLDLDSEEPTLVPYMTLEAGDGERVRYSGTIGWLASLYEGNADRLALLADQRATFGRLDIFASSEIDFDIGGAEYRDGVQLTRLNLSSTYRVAPWLLLRGGADRFEIPDTEAERDFFPDVLLTEDLFLDGSYWRTYVGATHQLPGRITLSEEVSYISGDVSDAMRWMVSLTRSGLPYFKSGSMTVNIYNLEGDSQQGYGGRISAYLPIPDTRISLEPSVVYRWVDFDGFSEDATFADAALRAHWRITNSWSVRGGVSYGRTDDDERVLFDVALTLQW